MAKRISLDKLTENSQTLIKVIEQYLPDSKTLFIIKFFDNLPTSDKKKWFLSKEISAVRGLNKHLQTLVGIDLLSEEAENGKVYYAFGWGLHNAVKSLAKQII